MSTTMAPRILNVIRGAAHAMKTNITSSPFSCLDIFLLCISTTSFVADIGTDVIVIVQYYVKQHYMWMMLTMSLVCIPSLLIQIFSIRWHIMDGDSSNFMWAVHIMQLGVFHRYIRLFKIGLQVRKSKSTSELSKFNQQQSDICMLRLFESFMESAPQLVLQLYIMVSLEDWSVWTGVSAVASVFSLSWGIAAYSKTMRNVRPEKNHLSWYGLIFQAFWRIGAVSARIISMVLFAVAYGPYLLLVMFFHWLCMTVWVITQNTDFCNTWWEERLYNGIVGTIYCFCFFNLKEGHSRWRMVIFYSITSCQNIGFLLVYYFSTEAKPNQGDIAISLVLVGMVGGLTSMLLYYRFFHPSGPISFYNDKRLKKAMEEEDGNKISTENCSTLKTYRKPYPSLSLQEYSPKDHSSQDEDVYALVSNGADQSVLSGQSRLGCQSDLHRSHSLNCSADDCDMENKCVPGYYRKKRFLSKSEANHLRTVNYNFRSVVAFGELKTAFHCSCLVLINDHYDKSSCDSLFTLHPSVSLPNLKSPERCSSPALYFLSDIDCTDSISNQHSVTGQSHVQSDVYVSGKPVEKCNSPALYFLSNADCTDSVSDQHSQTEINQSCAQSEVYISVLSDLDQISSHQSLHLSSETDHSGSDQLSQPAKSCVQLDESAVVDVGKIHFQDDCTSSTPVSPELYKIEDVLFDLSNTNINEVYESPTISPQHVLKLSISY